MQLCSRWRCKEGQQSRQWLPSHAIWLKQPFKQASWAAASTSDLDLGFSFAAGVASNKEYKSSWLRVKISRLTHSQWGELRCILTATSTGVSDPALATFKLAIMELLTSCQTLSSATSAQCCNTAALCFTVAAHQAATNCSNHVHFGLCMACLHSAQGH